MLMDLLKQNRIDNKIYITKDYSCFKSLQGNREVLEKRRDIIRKSIEENGYIRNPIVVNEKMEIIDGQGRFEALKELGFQIEYVIAYGAGQKECIALNISQKNWTSMDYVKSYMDMGNREYRVIYNMKQMFPNQEISNIAGICTNINNGGGSVATALKSGKIKLYNEETIIERLKFYEKIHNIISGDTDYGLQRPYAAIVNFVYECKEINENRILEQLERCKAFITPSFTTIQVLRNLEFIYNRSRKKKIYFMPLYDEWKSNTDNR